MTWRPPPFVRSATFRLTLLAASLFAAVSAFLLLYIYGATAVALARQTDRAVVAELEALTRAYRENGGLSALNRAVIERSLGAEERLYLLAYENGRLLSGNLDTLPTEIAEADAPARFTYQRAAPGGDGVELRRARGRMARLPGGYQLLVGVDVEEDARVVGRIAREAWTAAGFVLLLALAAGAFLSRRFVRRVDALNAVARKVRSGDLHARAPRADTGDELDTLAANFNAMLDRLEQLMVSMRHAGDSIAHDLRSPLTRLRGRLETALIEADQNGGGAEALERAVGEADGLLATFDAVLRITRLQAGEKRTAFEPVDLSALISDLSELYEPACEDAGLEFACEAMAGARLKADRALVSQAVANLLDNAVKYTPSGGAVALRLRKRRSGEYEVSVTDTGPGVPAADRERVKERFVRLDESRSHAGSGLGLTLVQAVADAHNGRFELDEGPGAAPPFGPGLRAALVFPLELAI